MEKVNLAKKLALFGEHWSPKVVGELDVVASVSEVVQETDLCPEFERRLPGTGSRG